MNKFAFAFAVLLMGAGAPSAYAEPAPASAAVAPTVGATVYDLQGGEVGKIVSVANGSVVIDTGKNEATVELSSIGAGKSGPAIGYTRDQLDAAVAAASGQAAAALNAALVAGAEVKAQDGVVIGKVGKVTADAVVIERNSAKPVSLPRDALMLKDGALSLLFTAPQFEEAIGKATAPATASAGVPATTGG